MINKITLINRVKIIDNEYVIKVKENNISKNVPYINLINAYKKLKKILKLVINNLV